MLLHIMRRPIQFKTLLVLLCGCLTGCATLDRVPPELTKAQLLDPPGTALRTATPAPTTSADVSLIDASMQHFVAQHVDRKLAPAARLTQLLQAMRTAGLFSLDYNTFATGTVAATFHGHEANCLSFTMLFVALAREAGLNASYQIVDVPPVWASTANIIVRETHINARIAGGGDAQDIVVDFNGDESFQHFPPHPVSDRYALALFYSNVGAGALVEGDYAQGFRNFRTAIRTDDQIPSLWVNLGLLYARTGWNAGAQAAYRQALALDAGNTSALNNLASLYAASGREDLAQRYRAQVARIRERNPYYVYALALQAQDAQEYGKALHLIERALKIAPSETRFQSLQASLRQQLGKPPIVKARFDQTQKFPGVAPSWCDWPRHCL